MTTRIARAIAHWLYRAAWTAGRAQYPHHPTTRKKDQ